jgi:hypothetical protein
VLSGKRREGLKVTAYKEMIRLLASMPTAPPSFPSFPSLRPPPHPPQSVGITDIIKLVLSGKRREGLKVTAYKEMIRLLASMPTSKHISMIETEWKRKELHR